MPTRPAAVLFDLLTALLDSWSLWNAVAGSAADGARWRGAYLRRTYATGAYRPYETLVAESAVAVGLQVTHADALAARWGELAPWPDAPGVLVTLHDAGVPLAVVTNCSEALGHAAAARLGVPFDVVVTAERAGWYKPDPRPYALALRELGVAAGDALFVAGSPFDLFGTARAGLPAWWHDRIGMTPPPDAPAPRARHATLAPLLGDVLGPASR